MEAFKTIIWIVNIFSSLAIIGLVLMQHGKGADAGANFGGSGSAHGVFGSGGNANFLTRMTGVVATIFFASCLALTYINTKHQKASGLDFSDVQQTTSVASSAPASLEQISVPVASASSASEVSSMGSNIATATATAATVATAKAVADGKKAEATNSKTTASKKAEKAETKKATTNKTKAKTSSTTKKATQNKK